MPTVIVDPDIFDPAEIFGPPDPDPDPDPDPEPEPEPEPEPIAVKAPVVKAPAPAYEPLPPEVQIKMASDLTQKTVCIKLNLSRLGNTRKVSTANVEVNADKNQLRLSKFLLDSPELKAIGTFDGTVRNYLYNICLPFEVGIHLLPIKALTKVEDKLKVFAAEREELIAKFIHAYPDLVKSAKDKLRSLYIPTEYPPASEAEKAFEFYWQYISFGVPDALQEISSEIWDQEREKAAKHMSEASMDIQAMLTETMAQLVQHMADRLKSDAEGKPLKFKETTVSKLVEFLENFSFRNVTDDKELEAVVAEARALLNGVDSNTLRNTDIIRDKVQKGMAGIAEQLNGMVTKVGSRKFQDDE